MAATALLGLAGGIGSGAASAANATKPTNGGTLTYIPTVSTTSMAPEGSGGPEVDLGGWERFAVYDGLVVQSQSGKVIDRIAQSFQSTNGTVWTLKVRPNVRFSDGSTLNATAIKSDWTTEEATPNPDSAFFKQISSLTVLNPLTLQITLTAPDQQFPAVISQSALDFISAPSALATAADHPVGAGPFEMKSWNQGTDMVLTPNPYYYGTKPHLSQLVFKYISDPSQAYNTLTTGGANMMITGTPSTMAKGASAGLTTKRVTTSGGWLFWYNLNSAPFNTIKAREALAYALTTKAMNEALFNGGAVLSPTILAPGSAGYTPKYRQLQPNHARAQALFNQLAAAGKPLNVTFLTLPSEPNSSMVQWMQTDLQGYKHVTAHVSLESGAEYSQSIEQKTFQVAVQPLAFYSVYPSMQTYLTTTGAYNFIGYSNRAVDNAFDLLPTASSTQAADKATNTIITNVDKDIPIYQFIRNTYDTFSEKGQVGGVTLLLSGMPVWNKLYLKK